MQYNKNIDNWEHVIKSTKFILFFYSNSDQRECSLEEKKQQAHGIKKILAMKEL